MIDNRILLESGMALVVLVACLFFLIKRGRQGQGFYDILYISDGKLTILAGIPISYPLEDISRVEFSTFATTKSGFTNFMGQLRIIKKDGRISRPYWFDSSVLYQKFVTKSTKEEMEETIHMLMAKLESQGIPSRMVVMK